MDYEIENIIFDEIYKEQNNIYWEIYKINIINNFNNINFINKIDKYIPCDRRLYISRPQLREKLYHYIHLNKNIFIEIGYRKYIPKEQNNITYEDIYDFIEVCVKILAKKQQGK